jgi:hypothetical protein
LKHISETTPKTYVCYRAGMPIIVDGHLSDAPWKSAPWTSMAQYAGCTGPPAHGDQWRVNFSRVEWAFDYHQGGYVLREGVPCDNWVWSP